jgi:tetratricopeptide (TPR) repeat protein
MQAARRIVHVKTRLAIPAALLLALSTTSSGAELPAALNPSFEEGVRALKAEKLGEAEAAFLRVLQQPGGKVAFVHNNLGIVYARRGQHLKATEQFREAIRLDSSYVAPRILLGASLLSLDRTGEATAVLEEAVKLAPREPLARLQLGKAYDRAGNRTGGVEQYRVLRQLAPKDPEYAYELGRAYLRVSEWTLGELKRLDPQSARLHQARGHTFRVQGRTEQALHAFERAARADPTLPEIHLALAQIYLEEKRYAEALQEVERELRLVPESAGARALGQQIRAEEAKPQ